MRPSSLGSSSIISLHRYNAKCFGHIGPIYIRTRTGGPRYIATHVADALFDGIDWLVWYTWITRSWKCGAAAADEKKYSFARECRRPLWPVAILGILSRCSSHPARSQRHRKTPHSSTHPDISLLLSHSLSLSLCSSCSRPQTNDCQVRKTTAIFIITILYGTLRWAVDGRQVLSVKQLAASVQTTVLVYLLTYLQSKQATANVYYTVKVAIDLPQSLAPPLKGELVACVRIVAWRESVSRRQTSEWVTGRHLQRRTAVKLVTPWSIQLRQSFLQRSSESVCILKTIR